ncbi:cytochrome c oxidase assembly protein COX15 homolog isoform X1 [Nasonia vitripennis]|uniref:Cytochrome c oxidase assembly protein COX15 homolog n=2 Tax=Nasonia vitripennis TaxID=7425 RepID=A0A7M7QCH6_NASVI|nr:cytochrome c oxidase assembly protein COX15 homolog isoform X1 [Nasonia vitripennis]XP_032457092.1 cytochrome c oxidase assembly protein COX15 homolog isoform X1 [Nasonia vitripennis]
MMKISYHKDKVIFNYKPIKSSQSIVGYWLLTCSGMVFIAVSLGGITRLTESGLSMVSWTLFGEKVPTTEISWIDEFKNYKQFPEYQISNKNMTLEEFKRIWWMEYAHRMWGRLIGVVFIVPAVYFWFNNMLNPVTKKRILILGTLIGCQGLMGWYMVKSGLENRFDGPTDVPRVSQYRLAAHLGLAIFIYSGLLYTTLDQLIPVRSNTNNYNTSELKPTIKYNNRFRILAFSSKGLIFLTALSGAFVAGLDAGLIYNTFPKMCNKWIPDDILFMSPLYKNLTENPTTVQFNHRTLGMSTLLAVSAISWMSRKCNLPRRASTAVIVLTCAAYTQAILGIFTLLNHVPTYLAALHQSGSLLLLSSAIWLCHEIKYIKKLAK